MSDLDIALDKKRRITISGAALVLRAEAANSTDTSIIGCDDDINICPCTKKKSCDGSVILNARRCGNADKKNCCYCCGCPFCNKRVLDHFENKSVSSSETIPVLASSTDVSNDHFSITISAAVHNLNISEQLNFILVAIFSLLQSL
jgi:hypothetical protein